MKRYRLAERRKAIGLSQEKLAEAMGVDRSTVARWERAAADPQPWHRPKLAAALLISTEELAELLANAHYGGNHYSPQDDLADLGLDRQDDDVDRRTFLPMTALPVLGGLPAIVDLLTPFNGQTTKPPTKPAVSLVQAERLTGQVKTLYQACHYRTALELLPNLIAGLAELAATSGPELKPRIAALTADAYHVVASIMLKLGDNTLATLAAQRALETANSSGDLVAVTCSARIMTHVLMSIGHGDRAISLASHAADTLRGSTHEWNISGGLSAFGALMLRAAIAAARMNDRSTALALAAEAQIAAARLGHDANDRWTGFGPTNVDLHKVNIALTLGDAGTAINLARKIDLKKITLSERKACLFTDVAQAYLQWGKQSAALTALEMAYRVAPEEIRNRPLGRRICDDLIATTRGPVRDRTIRFAQTVGLHLEH